MEIRLQSEEVIGTSHAALAKMRAEGNDRTGLADRFDIDFKWDEPDREHRKPKAPKQALLDQLGLELVPRRELFEMLVVERAKK
jgi:uncharacterized protein (TIGR03435 family)